MNKYSTSLEEARSEIRALRRELEIEAALEKIRTRTMAMQKSDELAEVSYLLNKQVVEMGIPTRGCVFHIYNEHDSTEWFSNLEGTLPTYKTPRENIFLKYYEAGQRGETLWIEEFGGERIKEHYEYLFSLAVPDKDDETVDKVNAAIPDFQIDHVAYFKYGYLLFITLEPVPEAHEVFKRFAKEFEQTYTRFLDLQKAEARTREALIEAALERVRAKVQAMRSSDDLIEVANVLRDEMGRLGQPELESFIVHLYKYESSGWDWEAWWAYRPPDDPSGEILNGHAIVPVSACEYTRETIEKYCSPATEYLIESSGKKLLDWYRVLERIAPQTVEYHEQGHIMLPEVLYYHHCKFSGGSLLMISNKKPTQESCELQRRAAAVFDLAYRRFLDLQKAEAQAREAQIEAALERVRARTMGMRLSSDLHEVIKVVMEQLLGLGLRFNVTNFARIHSDGSWDLWLFTPDQPYPAQLYVPYLDHPIFNRVLENIQAGVDFSSDVYEKGEKDVFFRHFFEKTLAKNTPEERKNFVYGTKGFARSLFLTQDIWFAVVVYDCTPFTDEENAVLRRFAGVFEQSYTRFLDLQKAEEQAREAQIEAALERVRARTMAMHESSELIETAELLFDQLKLLGAESQGVAFAICDKESTMVQKWTSIGAFSVPYTFEPGEQRMYVAWKNQVEIYEEVYEGEKLKVYYELLMQIPEFREGLQRFIDSGHPMPTWQKNHTLPFKHGYLLLITSKPFEEKQIFVRFAKVFEQTYTRFLDLQKAEAQAREAQIEAALERVRSRSIAMRKSEEIADIAGKIFSELWQLDLLLNRVLIWTFNDTEKYTTWWSSNPEVESTAESYRIDYNENPVFINYLQAWQQRKPVHLFTLSGDTKKTWEDHLFEHTEMSRLPVEVRKGMRAEGTLYTVSVISDYGLMMSGSFEPLSEASIDIIQRFGRVFQQSYTRYLDVQKAEAQAREAQIEAALERVRAQTMSMHNSQDVGKCVLKMFGELTALGVDEGTRFGIGILNHDNENNQLWTAKKDGEEVKMHIGNLNMASHPLLKSARKAWKKQVPLHTYVLEGEDLLNYYQMINNAPDYKFRVALEKLPEREFHYGFVFDHGFFYAFSHREFQAELVRITQRFSSVFSQTYRRYLDLVKAEAQAREAQIEAALERVRAKAMAMHSSQDLADTIGTFYTQLKLFNLVPRRCGVGLLNKHNKEAEVFTWNTTENGESLELVGKIRMHSHPVLENVYNSWITQTEYHPVLRGNEIREYYQVIRPQMAFPEYQNEEVHYGYFFMFEEGGVYAWKETPLQEDELAIYRRFTSVLSLTYKRYKDLKDAEALAKEAVKQATLDRVRAEIASMRTVSDLDRITPLIWRELTTLGIPFLRCGVFIMHDSLRQIHTFLSTPDGSAIAAFHLPYDAPGRTREILSNWMNKKEYIEHWDETAFSELGDLLVQQGALPSKDVYLQTVPQGGIHLHCLPFLQGMLYVGNTEKLRADDIQLIQSVADAFSTAYARYEDFNRLEAAKQQVDKALVELKQAQQQLVQSEKMASLGELTAGIAHEIQNPLNFVNNFSEVNKELLIEMEEAIQKGDYEEANAIARDISENQEKINHHGKRAESIVKGMLQHSRISSGQKEPTDINSLCDEYLRLAFHGLRAKDKSFNARFETDFDSSLPKINVVSQDIGRVVLNLINNAFYAVNEKYKTCQAEPVEADRIYVPQVIVATKSLGDKIEISVKDNGLGIPDHLREKIFQPFFTTKPTGQGTGLGLSLAYDIVTKGHGGELRVETKEGEGSELMIVLPV